MAHTRRQSVTQPDCKAVVCCSVRQKSSSARPRLRGGGSRRSLCRMGRPRRAELDRRAARPAQRGFCQHGGAGVEQVQTSRPTCFRRSFLFMGRPTKQRSPAGTITTSARPSTKITARVVVRGQQTHYCHSPFYPSPTAIMINLLECTCNCHIEFGSLQWALMGGLLHLVQRGDWAWPQPAQPHAPPCCTKCNSLNHQWPVCQSPYCCIMVRCSAVLMCP